MCVVSCHNNSPFLRLASEGNLSLAKLILSSYSLNRVCMLMPQALIFFFLIEIGCACCWLVSFLILSLFTCCWLQSCFYYITIFCFCQAFLTLILLFLIYIGFDEACPNNKQLNNYSTILLLSRRNTTLIPLSFFLPTYLPTYLPVLPFYTKRSLDTANHSSIPRPIYRPTHLSL